MSRLSWDLLVHAMWAVIVGVATISILQFSHFSEPQATFIALFACGAAFATLTVIFILHLPYLLWYALRWLVVGILPTFMWSWARNILGIIRVHRRGITRALVSSFFNTYARQEAAHLFGRSASDGSNTFMREYDPSPSSRHRIYTSFVAYSSIVYAVLVRGLTKRISNKGDLVCITSLAMPLPQWFNNKIDVSNTTLFPYVGTDDDWNKYLRLMYSLVHDINRVVPGRRRDLKIYRMLQVYTGAEPVPPIARPFVGEDYMKKLAKSHILLRGKPDWDQPEVVEALEQKEIAEVLTELPAGELKQFIQENYGKSLRGFLIVPEKISTLPTVSGYTWVLLIDAFRRLFCPSGSVKGKGFSYQIDEERYAEWFTGHAALPHDFFLIGIEPKGDAIRFEEIDWLICFEARIDHECQMARLEYVTRRLDADRIGRIESFVEEIREAILRDEPSHGVIPLSRWLED